MMRVEVSCDNAKYDKRHDVLHVFLGSSVNAFAEEEYPGVYVNRNEDTNEIVGLTVMDFEKRKPFLLAMLSEYSFGF